MNRFIGRFALALSVFGALAASSASAQIQNRKSQKSNPTSLLSDMPVYAPGTLAVLSGSSFVPTEHVTLQVVRADGTPTTGSAHIPWTVTASDRGRFVTSWLVCEDCVGSTLLVTAYGHSSGAHAQTSIVNNNTCGTGVVTSVTPVGGACSAFTPAVGNGPDNYEVVEGGTYVITIDGVTECSGDTITVFIQSSDTGNFCFDAIGGSGSYSGTFTMPNPACNTLPINYKCGSGATCTNPGSFGAQGPTSGCGGVHLRASTFDANCVRTGSDTDCTPPPAIGSCCLVDGTCVEVTQQECFDIGGTYNGDGSACSGVTCPPVAGACCLPDGSCVQVSADDCAAAGGNYGGDGSLCKDATCPPPTGACCLVDGTCVGDVTAEECAGLNGTYNGDGSACSGVTCPPAAGACCLPDGSCVQVSLEDCIALDGIYNGDLSQCVNVTCPDPTGACCLVDGSCIQVTEEQCAEQGGSYNGDDSDCGSVFCPDLLPDCFVLGFDTDDDGNSMPHGAIVDAEFDCNGTVFPVAISGSVNFSGSNSSSILNSTTGPSSQDPDLLVGKGNILILQTDANLNQCPPNSGVYCSHNDDENGGRLSFAFCVPAIPSSIVLVDIDNTDLTSRVVLTDVNGKTRTYVVPGNWTGDKISNFPEPGWKVLSLTTMAGQIGFATTATASEDAGYDPSAVVNIDVLLGGSGGVDDLSWCQ
jgi:hypothetical protein